MITALQSSKLKTVTQLLQAEELIRERLAQICLTEGDREHLQTAITHIGMVISDLAPSNDREPSTYFGMKRTK